MRRVAEQKMLPAELGLKMVPATRPPSFVPRLWMRYIKCMLTLRVMHRVAEQDLLQSALGLKMVPFEAAIFCATALDAPLILIRRSCIAWRNRFAAGRA